MTTHLPTRGIQDVMARQAPSRDDDGNILQLPSGGNATYIGSWTTFQIRNESLITETRSDETAHQLNVHQVMTGRSGNTKAKLSNQRIRQLAFQHNMVKLKHLTMITSRPSKITFGIEWSCSMREKDAE